MIVRHIIEDPAMPFDYFNDFIDTMEWLRRNPGLPGAEKAVESLTAGQKQWEVDWLKRTQQRDAI